jgi:hypothetical protein
MARLSTFYRPIRHSTSAQRQFEVRHLKSYCELTTEETVWPVSPILRTDNHSRCTMSLDRAQFGELERQGGGRGVSVEQQPKSRGVLSWTGATAS